MFTGIEAKYLSAKYWDQMGEFEDGDYLLISSYDPLINGLADNQNISLNTIVKCIKYDGNDIKLETNKGNFKADAVIVTVPLGVLQNEQIKFIPGLPDEKVLAIKNLKMSQLNKIGLLFPRQFWPADIVKIGYDADPLSVVPLFFNYAYYFDKPILLGAVSGAAAIELERAGKDVFLERTMSTLRKLFGNDIPDPLKVITTNWCSDPFSNGSYSYIPVGASGKEYDILAEPIDNKLFFAGEATYRTCHSTVQGAYQSGLREAMRIMQEY